MMTAKLFENGRSQAVRLPKEYRFQGDEVPVSYTHLDVYKRQAERLLHYAREGQSGHSGGGEPGSVPCHWQ